MENLTETRYGREIWFVAISLQYIAAFVLIPLMLQPRVLFCSNPDTAVDGWAAKMSKEAETGKIYVAGHDRWCRPVVVFDNSVQNTRNWEVCIFADMFAVCDCESSV